MTEKKKAPAGRLAGKLMLSGALILGSGAYAMWQHSPGTKMAAMPPAAERTAAIPMMTPEQPRAAAPSLGPPPGDASSPAPVATGPDQPQQAGPSAAAAENAPSVPADNAPPAQLAPPVALASSAPPEPEQPPEPPQPSGRYANGDFTGPSTDTPWGTVQVRARIQNGAISEIEPIDYPQHRRRSIQINEWALPILEREVIQAQSADVDIVSQATTTSVGYLRSLAAALGQAKK